MKLATDAAFSSGSEDVTSAWTGGVSVAGFLSLSPATGSGPVAAGAGVGATGVGGTGTGLDLALASEVLGFLIIIIV